jgi:hypothetical protein
LKDNKVNLFLSSLLFVFWYHSPNVLDTPRIILGGAFTLTHFWISVFRWSVLLLSSVSNMAFSTVMAFTKQCSPPAKTQAEGPHNFDFSQLPVRYRDKLTGLCKLSCWKRC